MPLRFGGACKGVFVMRDLTGIVVTVADLQRMAQSLAAKEMAYVLLDIGDDEGEKRLYFRAVPSAQAETDIDFGYIRSFAPLDNI